jgi:hypothetical protein
MGWTLNLYGKRHTKKNCLGFHMWISELPHESQVNVNSLSQKSFRTYVTKLCDYIQDFEWFDYIANMKLSWTAHKKHKCLIMQYNSNDINYNLVSNYCLAI